MIFFCVACIFCSFQTYSQYFEICDNGIDDDGDGFIDINDTDCICPMELPLSLIPNPSFEDMTGCPLNENMLELAVSWQQASSATTDYIHQCGGFLSHTLFNDDVPLPMPDGMGCIGFRNGKPLSPNFKEYTGACLTEPLEEGVRYTLNMWVGFMNEVDSPGFELTVFGASGCQSNGILPFGGDNTNIGCPMNVPGYEQLGSERVEGVSEWVNTIISFTPNSDLDVIVIGANCDPNPFDHYYFFDNLILQKTIGFGESLGITGHPCTQNVVLNAPSFEVETYQWYKNGIAIQGETEPAFTIPDTQVDAANYQLLVTFEDGSCELSSPFLFEIPDIITMQSLAICDNEPVQLDDQSVNETGIYTELLVNAQNCDSTVITDLTVLPSYDISIERIICEKQEYILGTQVLNISGTYTEIFSSVTGCDSVVTVDLTVLPSLIRADAQGDASIRLGEQTPLQAELMNLDQLDILSWASSNSLEQICDTCLFQLVRPERTTTYTLRTIDVQGCEIVDNVVIEVDQFYDIFFPNVFSPNQDGVNDFYYPHGTNNIAQILRLDVYDRWGNLVFNNRNFLVSDESNGWDGRYRNQNANVGVYVYVAEVEFIDGIIQQFKGDFILSR